MWITLDYWKGGAIRIAWPHHTTLRTSLIVAFLVGALQLAALLAGAYFDGTLWMPRPAVGLFENPGMFSIVFGDVALIIICTIVSRMTRKMGRKLPSLRPTLVRRYFRLNIDRRLFDRGGAFQKILIFLMIIGAMAVANQTVQMFNPIRYYGHKTFADWGHTYSFIAVRCVIIISWCVVIPIYFTYLLSHVAAIHTLIRASDRHNLAMFDEKHPDKSGGYSFFGWLDTFYAFGILVVLLEVVLIIVTHSRPTLGSVLAMCALAAGALVMSMFSVGGTLRLVRRQERKLKVRAYSRHLREPAPADLDTAVLNFGLNFSPYTTTTLRLAIGLRTLMAAPAVLHALQYVVIAT